MTFVRKALAPVYNLKSIKIPKPDLPIQEKIVSECEAIDQATETAKNEVEKAKREIEGKIDSIYASNYINKKLASICKLQRGRFAHRPRNEPRFFGGEYPFIQTGDIVRAKGKSVRFSQTLNEEGLLVSKLFQPTIVLITIAANIGDTAILDYPACFTDSVVGLIPNAELNPYFLELMMRKQKKYLDDSAPKMAQKNINIEILNTVKIPVPPLEMQSTLVSEIEILEKRIAENEAIIKNSAGQKQAVLKKYL